MAQLTVRNVDDEIAAALKARAAKAGRSAEAEHRLSTSPNPMTEAEAHGLVGRTVEFGKAVEDELEEYAEAGMRARILSIHRRQDDLCDVAFDFAPFYHQKSE